MKLTIPFDVEIRGTATSSYTDEHIDRRLAVLAGRTDAEAERERKYLTALKAKRKERQ